MMHSPPLPSRCARGRLAVRAYAVGKLSLCRMRAYEILTPRMHSQSHVMWLLIERRLPCAVVDVVEMLHITRRHRIVPHSTRHHSLSFHLPPSPLRLLRLIKHREIRPRWLLKNTCDRNLHSCRIRSCDDPKVWPFYNPG